MHYGIKGQKWGVRRFQNEDGTYTEEGKIRYSKSGMPEKYKTKDIQEDAKRLHDMCRKNYIKFKDERGQISISDDQQKAIKDVMEQDSQYVKARRRMREKQQKYNDALKTLDLNRRINTYKTLNEAQKEFKFAALGAMFRAVKKLPKEQQEKAFGWMYLHAPNLAGVIDDDFYS